MTDEIRQPIAPRSCRRALCRGRLRLPARGWQGERPGHRRGAAAVGVQGPVIFMNEKPKWMVSPERKTKIVWVYVRDKKKSAAISIPVNEALLLAEVLRESARFASRS